MTAPRTGFIIGLTLLWHTQSNAQVSISIDTTIVYQTMDGFGTSERVFNDPHVIGGAVADPITAGLVISTAEEDAILDLLYIDLGLTRVRPATGEEGDIEDPNDNNDPYDTDTTQFDFTWKKMDAHIDLVERMIPRGVDTYLLSTLRLEPWMTEAEPEEYVEWAFTTIKRWKDRGVELPLYSIVNEPGYSFSGIWSGEFLRDCIKLLGPKLDSAGMITRIMIPDDLNATQAIDRAQVIMADSIARSYVAALGYHLYGGSDADKTAMMQLAQQYDIPVWMTEYSRPDAFDWANVMHEEIADFGASAVDNMWGYWGAQANAAYISLNYTGTTYTGYTINKHYYVTGQYSKYVRPGARRVEASSSNTDVRVTAYTRDAGMAIVVLNNHGVPQVVDITTNGMGTGTLAGVRTSATENWAVLPNSVVTGGSFTTTLPPNSITTFFTEDFSTSVPMHDSAPQGIMLYPNPASTVLGMKWTTIRPGSTRIVLTDQRGRIVKEEVVLTGVGTAQLTLPLHDLANGVYLVSAQVDGAVLRSTLIVAH